LEGKVMKISKITISAAAAMLVLTLVARAGDTPTPNPFLAVLSTSTQAELPAKAADLVAQADAKQQRQTTIDVVKAAVGLNPAAAAAIVGSIAQTTPAMAAIAASTAAGLVPNQAATIARAAAAAAPQQAGKIVEAICRVLPAAYAEVAGAVADVVPGAGKEILTAISTGIPALKDTLNKVLASYKGNVPSVSTVLDQVQSSVQAATAAQLPQPGFGSPLLAPPIGGPPYVPIPPTHQNLDPGSGGQVPTNGRNYATPVPP
jgi:hypothetical protein